jgi:hypothetical protein
MMAVRLSISVRRVVAEGVLTAAERYSEVTLSRNAAAVVTGVVIWTLGIVYWSIKDLTLGQ